MFPRERETHNSTLPWWNTVTLIEGIASTAFAAPSARIGNPSLAFNDMFMKSVFNVRRIISPIEILVLCLVLCEEYLRMKIIAMSNSGGWQHLDDNDEAGYHGLFMSSEVIFAVSKVSALEAPLSTPICYETVLGVPHVVGQLLGHDCALWI